MRVQPALIAAAIVTLAASPVLAGPLDKTECIAPAKPGGGFDLTCKLAQSSLAEAKAINEPMRVTYMPGGIGAVAYNAVVAQRPDSRQHDRRLFERLAAEPGAGQVRPLHRERRALGRRRRQPTTAPSSSPRTRRTRR